jgi:hypothetical protein
MVLKQHNSTIPICQLPAELLIHILLDLQTKAGAHEPTDSNTFRPPCYYHDFSWVRATWVCTHIRTVAIGAPKLWPWVDYKNSKEWNVLTVARAGEVVLNVNMPMFDFDYDDLVAKSATAPYLVKAGRARFDFSSRETTALLVQNPSSLRLTEIQSCNFDGPSASKVLNSIASQLVRLQVDTTRIQTWPALSWPKLRLLKLINPHI